MTLSKAPAASTGPAPSADALIARLSQAIDPESINLDEADRRFYSQDLFFQGELPLAIVRPRNTADVVNLVKLCAAEGIALFPRGGGMSYTQAFQPKGDKAVLLDTSGLNEISPVSADKDYVTAGAGCTWAALDKALATVGMRSRFWGPMSGGTATLGGSISQGSVTFGSGNVGASGNAVKSFEIVTGTGTILHSGSDGSVGTEPFNRNYGPDLTGIFANDAGALGIKTAITLEIEPRPEKVTGLSFAFDDFDAMAQMFHSVTVRRLSSEMIAMDAEVARQNSGPPDLMSDIKAMWKIGNSAGNPLAAIGRMASVALAGRGFLDKAHYTAHFVVEGRDAKDLASKVKSIRGFAKAGTIGGDEIVNTVPLMTRADPFPSLPVTHPDGRRMLPIHGIFPTPALGAFHRDYLALKADFKDRMEAVDVTIAEFFASIAGVGLLYEPVFYWPDVRFEYHDRMTPDYLTGGLADYPSNDAGHALVEEMIEAIVALMRAHGSTHFQLGRLYPYAEAKQGAALDFVKALKRELDPYGIINPGALGL